MEVQAEQREYRTSFLTSGTASLVDQALRRFEADQYLDCKKCGEPIAEQRLLALLCRGDCYRDHHRSQSVDKRQRVKIELKLYVCLSSRHLDLLRR